MAIAFYNVGIELEHLKQYAEAQAVCRQGIVACSRLLGAKHTLCDKLVEAVAALDKRKRVHSRHHA